MKDLPLLPTTVVGSHGHPGWWHEGKAAYEAGKWGPYDLEELFNDAADIAILDQERAGVDISDGEVRRLDGYVDSYYNIIGGLRPIPPPGRQGPGVMISRRAMRPSARSSAERPGIVQSLHT